MATSAASYLVGNRVYNGGTNNPTSGTVDPSGYVQREVNNSNRRSGLASSLLNGGSQPPPAPTTPSVQQPSSIQTSSTGRLILVPNSDPTSQQNVLPFDPATGQQQVTATKAYGDQLDSINTARHLLQQKVAAGQHSLDINIPVALRTLLNHYAGRGMAHSSGYGYAYGQDQASFADKRAALQQQLQEGLAGYDQQQQSTADQYNMLLAQLAAQSAGNSASNGGAAQLSSLMTPAPAPTVPAKVTAKQLTPTKTKAVAKKIVSKGAPNKTKPIIKGK